MRIPTQTPDKRSQGLSTICIPGNLVTASMTVAASSTAPRTRRWRRCLGAPS